MEIQVCVAGNVMRGRGGAYFRRSPRSLHQAQA